MDELSKTFDSKAIEQLLYEEWERRGYFKPFGEGPPFSIAIPPPNVTGTLHLGHAFQQTLMDAVIRYRRMSGNDTLWQTGTDHAGISTQMVVTEQLKAQGLTPTELGRAEFVDRVWQWRSESGNLISQQIRRIGASVDWERERFTMDPDYSRCVLEVFVRLFDEGLIYRGKRLVNWDPSMQTALSDLEVISEFEPGHLWYIRYPLRPGLETIEHKDYLVVATTRPETMFGDTAVAIHPDDPRYQSLVGKSVNLPLVDREIPIIADDHVDPDFGTGCLKITPAHDFDDNTIGTRHGLESITVIDFFGRLNDNVPNQFRKLDRFKARARIVDTLDTLGLIERVEPHEIQIPRGERSNEIVEPLLTDQWFVDIEALAAPAIRAVEDGLVKFVPKRWENVFFSWMRDIRDWCISRQLWWGHRIPAWYDSQGNIYVARSESEARKKYDLDQTCELTQDPDVLETWFSSSLWTFGTLGWPTATPELEKYHPTNLLITGHDIIFFWVARMIMMTQHFTGEIPFSTVYITGLIRDADGQKMSKTKGNGIDPLDIVDGISLDDLVEKRTSNLPQTSLAPRIAKATRRQFPDGIPAYGTDALRFTFCALASPSSSYNFDLARVEGYHHFCNKLWNAMRFVLTSTKDFNLQAPRTLSLADRWIESQIGHLTKKVHRYFNSYRFDLLAQSIYDFVWHEFCDWYVELTKPILYGDHLTSEELKKGTQFTLLHCSETILRLMHPVMPFITETLWRQINPLLKNSSNSIMLASYPNDGDFSYDTDAEHAIEWLKSVVNCIRTMRGERKIAPNQEVAVLLQGGSSKDRELEQETRTFLCKLSRVKKVTWVDSPERRIHGSVEVVNNLEVIIPFLHLDEIRREHQRLENELKKVSQALKLVQSKLTNSNFVERAPQAVVDREREKETSLCRTRDSFEAQLAVVLDAENDF